MIRYLLSINFNQILLHVNNIYANHRTEDVYDKNLDIKSDEAALSTKHIIYFFNFSKEYENI